MPLHVVILDRDNAPADVAGVHRVARLVNSAQQAGIERVTVVTDMEDDEVAAIHDSLPAASAKRRRFSTIYQKW